MADDSEAKSSAADEAPGGKKERRKISGNFPYTTSAGVLKKVLDRIPDAEKPIVFNIDFLAAVFGVTGGSARPIPPILKSTGFLNQSGSPTEIYSQFQTQSGRANAALQALKNGFPEIFKRNIYANKLGEKDLLDIIVAITGLPRTDGVVRAVLNTFQTFQNYAVDAREDATNGVDDKKPTETSQPETDISESFGSQRGLGLIYNINISLPETTNVEVYNAIFRSIRANLLQ